MRQLLILDLGRHLRDQIRLRAAASLLLQLLEELLLPRQLRILLLRRRRSRLLHRNCPLHVHGSASEGRCRCIRG